jgi:hypothetical protein
MYSTWVMLYSLNHIKFVGKDGILIFLSTLTHSNFDTSETDSNNGYLPCLSLSLSSPGASVKVGKVLKSFPIYYLGERCVEPFLTTAIEWFSLLILVSQSACNSIWRACSSEEVGEGGRGERGAGEVTGSLLSKYERGRRRRRSPWAGYNRKSLSPPPPSPPPLPP